MQQPSNPVIFNAVTNATIASSAIPTLYDSVGSFQATFTDSAAAGTLVIQASNDPIELLPGSEAPIHWSNIANTSVSVTAGATTLIVVPNLVFRWIRVSWTRSAGAGTLSVTGFLTTY